MNFPSIRAQRRTALVPDVTILTQYVSIITGFQIQKRDSGEELGFERERQKQTGFGNRKFSYLIQGSIPFPWARALLSYPTATESGSVHAGVDDEKTASLDVLSPMECLQLSPVVSDILPPLKNCLSPSRCSRITATQIFGIFPGRKLRRKSCPAHSHARGRGTTMRHPSMLNYL